MDSDFLMEFVFSLFQHFWIKVQWKTFYGEQKFSAPTQNFGIFVGRKFVRYGILVFEHFEPRCS